MMTKIEERLQKDLVEAMKSKNEFAINAIRSVKTAIQNEKTNGKFHELSDNDVIKIIQKQVKQRQESEQIYLTATHPRIDLAEVEHKEAEFLEQYLPKMLTEEEIHEIIDKFVIDAKLESMKDMKRLMSLMSEFYPNQYDGKTVSLYFKSKFM